MKCKIFAILLSAFLCFGASFSSLIVVSYASVCSVLNYLEVGTLFFQFCNDVYQYLHSNSFDEIFKGKSDLEVRAILVAQFKNNILNIRQGFSKSELKDFVYYWSLQDYEALKTKFGQDVSSFCNTNSSYFFDYYKAVMYYFDNLDDYINFLYDIDLDGYGITDNGDVHMPIEALKDTLNKANTTLTPKNRTMYKYSWRDLSDTQVSYSGNYLARAVGKNGKFIDDTSYEDGIYIQPYAILGDVEDINGKNCRGEYYSPYQYRLYCVKSAAPADSGYEFKYQWKIDALFYQIDDGERLDLQTVDLVSWYVDYPYVTLGFGLSSYYESLLSFWFYDDYNQVVNIPYTPFYESFGRISSASFYDSCYQDFLLSTDTSVSFLYNHFLAYIKNADFTDTTAYTTTTLSQFQEKCLNDNISDYGLLVSNTPFSTTYLFDITRLPDNATVTISGDSVYDYSITDNSTGDTSTIYNYVTNNYTYPDNSGGNTSGGSGGNGGNIGGNVIVGGQVDVGGKVEIDVNINGGGNGSANGNIGDYVDINSSDVDSNINDYLNLVPTLPKSFIDYMKDFFSWLPKEIYRLIVFGMIMLVVKLVLRRR